MHLLYSSMRHCNVVEVHIQSNPVLQGLIQDRFCVLPDRKGFPYRKWDPRMRLLSTCRIENLD